MFVIKAAACNKLFDFYSNDAVGSWDSRLRGNDGIHNRDATI
jgi:hypothetical protein